jgi:metallo-beta-lactamase family protein
MKLQFVGAARTVTGSCYYLSSSDSKVLADCGLIQGNNSHDRNRDPFPFDPKEISLLFLTHAHLDHSGLVPRLVKEGFRGKIVATSATIDLLELMLTDSAKIQESDAEWMTKKALRAGREPVVPLYTVDDVKRVMPLFTKVPYGQIIAADHGIRYRFLDAGHILGSGSLELWFPSEGREKKIVFSGDIGRKGNPIINDPTLSSESDFIVMESTYGNRKHKNLDESVNELADAIQSTYQRGGNVLIPAFAIGRTQDLLYVLNRLVREGRLPRITVYIDSPLAEEATKAYLAHPDCFDEEARRLMGRKKVGDALKVRFTSFVEESMAINRVRSRAVIIAGSGMCEGGRIRHHLKHNLWRRECSVIFVGFQAKGTLGRKIVDGEKSVMIFGEEIAVRAKVYTIGGFSAHADQKELLEWLSAFRNKPEVFVVHGEEETALLFADLVRQRYGFIVHAPVRDESFEL